MKKFLIIAVMALAFTNCVKQDAVKFHDLDIVSVSLGTTTRFNVAVEVENSSCRNIRISDSEFQITDRRGREIGTLSVVGDVEVVIPRKSLSSVEVPLMIRLTDPMAGLSILRDIKTQGPLLLVTGSAQIKAGVVKRKYEVENMPLSEFISIFDDNLGERQDLKVM